MCDIQYKESNTLEDTQQMFSILSLKGIGFFFSLLCSEVAKFSLLSIITFIISTSGQSVGLQLFESS